MSGELPVVLSDLVFSYLIRSCLLCHEVFTQEEALDNGSPDGCRICSEACFLSCFTRRRPVLGRVLHFCRCGIVMNFPLPSDLHHLAHVGVFIALEKEEEAD